MAGAGAAGDNDMADGGIAGLPGGVRLPMAGARMFAPSGRAGCCAGAGADMRVDTLAGAGTGGGAVPIGAGPETGLAASGNGPNGAPPFAGAGITMTPAGFCASMDAGG